MQGLLAPFRPAASRDDKLRLMFSVYDVDGAGVWWGREGWGRGEAAHPGWAGGSLPSSPAAGIPSPMCPLPRPSPRTPGDGAVSEEDMEIVLRQLAGSSLSDVELKSIISKARGGGQGFGRGPRLLLCWSGAACPLRALP